MFKKKSLRVRGFTLIEVLLYVALVGILLTGVSTFFLLTVQARTKYQTITEVEEQGTMAINLITQTIRNASAITTPIVNTSSSSIRITTLLASTTPTVFDLSGGVLRVTEGSGAPLSLTSSRVLVSSLIFYNVTRTSAPASVRVAVTISSVNPANKNAYEFSQTFYGTASLRYK